MPFTYQLITQRRKTPMRLNRQNNLLNTHVPLLRPDNWFRNIVTAFVLVVMCMFGLAGGCSELTSTQQARANKNVTNWIEALYPNHIVNMTCSTIDSDNDGYISCTVLIDGVNQNSPLSIECAYRYESGCRMAIMKTYNKSNQ